MTGNHKRKGREARTIRRETATERAAEREKRGDVGQLARLDKLGYTASRERKRLAGKAK